MHIEVKKLELSTNGSWYRRNIATSRFRKTMLAILAGGLAGFLFHYLTEGRELATYMFSDSLNSILMGGLLGFWITNSPCARGRC